MLKKILPIILTAAITMVLTTVFQPLSLLESTAQSQTEQTTPPENYGTCHRFQETDKSVCGKFLAYWYRYGGLRQFGYPISVPLTETSGLDGKVYSVQYFERAVFELHPENQPPYDVELAQLGSEVFKQKYPFGWTLGQMAPQIIDPQPDLAITKQLRQGILVSLKSQEQAATFGISEANCGPEMYWILRVVNAGNSSFVARLDTNNLKMVDNTGKSYPPNAECLGHPITPYSGSLSGPVELSPGGGLVGTLSFQVKDIPESASYLELQVIISGTPVSFRYVLP